MIPGAWGRETEARRSDGTGVSAYDAKACTFCSIGAVSAAQSELKVSTEAYHMAIKTLDAHARIHRLGNPNDDIVSFNDSRGRKEPVLEVFAVSADSLR